MFDKFISWPKQVHDMIFQAPSAAAEWGVGARAWRDAVGACWVPRHCLDRCLPHHRQGTPLLRQDHLVHRPLPLLCHVHPAWTGPHIARSWSKPFPRNTLNLSDKFSGAFDGLWYYVHVDWSKLMDGETWIDGATQIFFAYSVGMGALPALGSYNKFHHDCFRFYHVFSLFNIFGQFCFAADEMPAVPWEFIKFLKKNFLIQS